ncbi:MAG TPA: hypothetical protein VG937_39020 [Polyangiaceae bacterium]|nr:hypothetical protein [Polyangiaceae bacterium]
MQRNTGWTIGALGFSLMVTFGCKSKSEKPAPPPAASSSAAVLLPPPKRHNWPAPSGPVLAVLAGQGVGPIRIGATTATIERLMAAPCEVKTADVCRYPGRGVEFVLEKGVTQTVHIYRAGRPTRDQAGNPTEFGFFRGAIPPDVQLGMVPAAVQEHTGQPQSIERSDVTGPGERVETHHYPGLTIFYDRLENGNLVMAEIVVFKPAPADAAAPSAAPSAGRGSGPK